MPYELKPAAVDSGALSANTAVKNNDNKTQPQTGQKNTQTETYANEAAVKPTPIKLPANEVFAGFLRSAGMAATPENMSLPEFLIKNQIPLTEGNLRALNQAVKLFGGNLAKAGFLLLNGISPSATAAAALNSLTPATFAAHNAEALLSQLNALALQLDALPPNAKAVVSSLIDSFAAPPSSLQAAPQSNAPSGEAAPLPQAANSAVVQAAQQETNITQTKPKAVSAVSFPDMPATNAEVITLTAAKTNALPTTPTNAPQVSAETAIQPTQAYTQAAPQNTATNVQVVQPQINADAIKAQQPEQAQTLPLPASSAAALPQASAVQPLQLAAVPAELLSQNTQAVSQAADIPQPAASHELIQPTFAEKLISKFSLPVSALAQSQNATVIDGVLNQLQDMLTELTSLLQQQDSLPSETREVFNVIDRQLSFIAQIKNCAYVQFPITTANGRTTAELFVFRDRRKKTAGEAKTTSALIGLNLANLGRLETYVRKTGSLIECQFRASENESLNYLKQHIAELAEIFAAANLQLAGLHYKTIDQPFTLVDEEPNFTELPKTEISIGFDEFG